MSRCCSPFSSAADRHFDREKVARELERYRERGPGPTTRLLAEGIARSGAVGGSVLDVGSGLGALTFALLERGGTSAVAVDASSAYVEAGRAEAARRGRTGAVDFLHADFVEAAPGLPKASVVAMDRVVCCYPSCERLLDAALAHAERCLALSYPRDVWYVRGAMRLDNGRRWLARNPFRTFVHPVATIRETIARAGFALSSRHETWMWSADVYVRRPNSPARVE
jgi:SAM-dependent methyltransferase